MDVAQGLTCLLLRRVADDLGPEPVPGRKLAHRRIGRKDTMH
jgi:hypothetical protein